MAKRDQLRKLRSGTIINVSSKKMESNLVKALKLVESDLKERHSAKISWEDKIMLSLIVDDLKKRNPDIDFFHFFNTTYLKPDGGILFIVDKHGDRYPILISEAKRQGTNDLRAKEGLEKQSRGNAIERLGKNLIGFRVWLSHESIFPFVVFGEGNDFAEDSSILDRVATMSMFAPMNKVELFDMKNPSELSRGSFFFREESWTVEEIRPVLLQIAESSIDYYFHKHGRRSFL